MIREIIKLPASIFPKGIILYLCVFLGYFTEQYCEYIKSSENPKAYFDLIFDTSTTLSLINWKNIFLKAKSAFFFFGPILILIELGANTIKAYIKRKNDYMDAIEDNDELTQLIHDVGIISFRRNKDVPDKEENVEFLLEQIEASNQIKILGATGLNTFANPRAFLYDTVNKFEGELKILLLNPGIEEPNNFKHFKKEKEFKDFKQALNPIVPKEIKNRASDLKMTCEEYIEEIFKSIIFLTNLKGMGRFIELKLYQGPLVWKIIISGQYMWLQHYMPVIHVNNCPVYGILKTNPDTTIYNSFDAIFSRIWYSDHTIRYLL